MEAFSFVTPVTGLNRPNTGKEDDDDENLLIIYSLCMCVALLCNVCQGRTFFQDIFIICFEFLCLVRPSRLGHTPDLESNHQPPG
jgi:hypothetical protein